MKASHWFSAAAIAAIGIGLGLTGIGWGLPSARRVELLGGSIEKVRAELSVRSARDLESRRDRAAILATQPAEEGVDLPRLVRRYLLFSDSPDEPLTLLALANFRPRQLDFNPRMVEYGGLHVYGTGAALALAHVVGFGRITKDVMHYADHPEDIARLYIAGRFLMVLYNVGIALVLFVFGRSVAAGVRVPPAGGSLAASATSGFLAALLWLLSPPSLAFSHIINPHLPAAFWGTLAVWLAWRAGQSPNRRAWLGAAAASGAAASCALNAGLVFLAPGLVALFAWRKDRACLWRELGLAALVTVAMFLALNPYFFANLGVLGQEMARFRHFREPVVGLGSVAHFVGEALPRALGLFIVALMVCGALWLWHIAGRPERAVVTFIVIATAAIAWLSGSDASDPLTVRFATFFVPAAVLMMAVLFASALSNRWLQLGIGLALAAIIWRAITGPGNVCSSPKNYVASFLDSPRDNAGDFINRNIPPRSAIIVPVSPGPYELPAFDFSRFRLTTDSGQPHDYRIQVEETATPRLSTGYAVTCSFGSPRRCERTPLSFSGKLVRIYRRGAAHQ